MIKVISGFLIPFRVILTTLWVWIWIIGFGCIQWNLTKTHFTFHGFTDFSFFLTLLWILIDSGASLSSRHEKVDIGFSLRPKSTVFFLYILLNLRLYFIFQRIFCNKYSTNFTCKRLKGVSPWNSFIIISTGNPCALLL